MEHRQIDFVIQFGFENWIIKSICLCSITDGTFLRNLYPLRRRTSFLDVINGWPLMLLHKRKRWNWRGWRWYLENILLWFRSKQSGQSGRCPTQLTTRPLDKGREWITIHVKGALKVFVPYPYSHRKFMHVICSFKICMKGRGARIFMKYVQVDRSGWFKPPVDIKTKVVF